MNSQINSNLYPLDWMPESLRQVIWAAEAQAQSPIPLIAASTFSTMSTACQGLIDVAMPTGQLAPTSLFFLTSAESGERKTATDRLLNAPVLELDAAWSELAGTECSDLATRQSIWDIERGVIEAKLKRALKKGQPCDDLKEQFSAHQLAKPLARQVPHLLYSDATVQALLANLHDVWPHAMLASDEGGGLLGGHALRHLGVVNQLWDGVNAIRVDRKSAESFTLKDARLSLSIMVQKQPLEAFLKRKDNEALETGFLSRVLVAEPTSRQGTRQILGSVNGSNPEALHWFHGRVRELLTQTWEAHQAGQPRGVLAFNAEASAQWLQFAAWVENQIAPGGQFEDIRGFASKLTNHMSRLAAVMHHFQGKGSLIDIESTNAAIQLAIWYVNEFKRLFGAEDPITLQQQAGDLLWNWLMASYRKNGVADYAISMLYSKGPNRLRKRVDLEIALNNLAVRGLIQIFRNNKPAFIRMTPPQQYGIFQLPHSWGWPHY